MPRLSEALSEIAPGVGQTSRELDWIDHIFLKGLTAAEGFGLGGTPLKLYNDVVQRGRQAPITEQDFSPEEIAGLRRIVEEKASSSPSGKVDYRDYRGSGVSENILGGFQYAAEPNGAITVSDNYDFNTNRERSGDSGPLSRALGALFNPRGLAANIGRSVAPPGAGVKVHLNLEPKK